VPAGTVKLSQLIENLSTPRRALRRGEVERCHGRMQLAGRWSRTTIWCLNHPRQIPDERSWQLSQLIGMTRAEYFEIRSGFRRLSEARKPLHEDLRRQRAARPQPASNTCTRSCLTKQRDHDQQREQTEKQPADPDDETMSNVTREMHNVLGIVRGSVP
jgi:hypothetical protein